MTPLQSWLSKPRAIVRIDRTVPWAAWLRVLQRPFGGRHTDARPHIEVLDRLSLGGKKSLLLIAIEGRRVLVGVGEDASPSVTLFDEIKQVPSLRPFARGTRALRGRRMAR
jgi:flagellar biogenesis protein FliO